MELTETLLSVGKFLTTPGIVAIAVAYLNYRGKKRDDDRNDLIKSQQEVQLKQLDERNKVVIDRMESIEMVVNNVEKKLDQHILDDDFRQRYRNAIRNTIMVVLEASHTLKQQYKNMLMEYTDCIREFGLNFYYNERRKKNKREREKYLEQEKAIIIDNFCHYVDSNDETIRIFKNKKILFSEYLSTGAIFNSLDILIMRLVQNGLDEDEVIELFTAHIDKFIELFITASISWDSLQSINTDAA